MTNSFDGNGPTLKIQEATPFREASVIFPFVDTCRAAYSWAQRRGLSSYRNRQWELMAQAWEAVGHVNACRNLVKTAKRRAVLFANQQRENKSSNILEKWEELTMELNFMVVDELEAREFAYVQEGDLATPMQYKNRLEEILHHNGFAITCKPERAKHCYQAALRACRHVEMESIHGTSRLTFDFEVHDLEISPSFAFMILPDYNFRNAALFDLRDDPPTQIWSSDTLSATFKPSGDLCICTSSCGVELWCFESEPEKLGTLDLDLDWSLFTSDYYAFAVTKGKGRLWKWV